MSPAEEDSELCRLSKRLCVATLSDVVEESFAHAGHELSLYVPSATYDDYGDDEESLIDRSQPSRASLVDQLHTLNDLLGACGKEPVSRLNVPWHMASSRTIKRHVEQASDIISTVLTVVEPRYTGELWQAVTNSDLVGRNFSSRYPSDYLKAFVETYGNATTADTKRQALSILADMMPLKQLRDWIPGLSRYHYTEAKRHKMVYGRGAPSQRKVHS